MYFVEIYEVFKADDRKTTVAPVKILSLAVSGNNKKYKKSPKG